MLAVASSNTRVTASTSASGRVCRRIVTSDVPAVRWVIEIEPP
jgi:hypothetical protein